MLAPAPTECLSDASGLGATDETPAHAGDEANPPPVSSNKAIMIEDLLFSVLPCQPDNVLSLTPAL